MALAKHVTLDLTIVVWGVPVRVKGTIEIAEVAVRASEVGRG